MSGQEVGPDGRADGAPVGSRYPKASRGDPRAAYYTLDETERAISERLSGLALDVPAMAAVQNVYRAAGAIRNHLERTVLAPHDLTWTGWVVLWVVWIWGDIETRHVATESGISKATLTGVATTLETRRLLARRVHPDDGRRVLLSLTPEGHKLMAAVFPEFNREESRVTAALSAQEVQVLTRALRKIVEQVERSDAVPTPRAAAAE